MAQLEEQLNQILGNPQAMDQIMSLAQSLSGKQEDQASEQPAAEPEAEPADQPPAEIDTPSPLSALDGVIKESIKDRIKTIAREYHLTTIIVTHDPEEALTLSDRVLIIDQGTISQYAKPDEIIHQPKNDFVRKFILRQLEIKRGNIYALFGDRPQLAGEAV